MRTTRVASRTDSRTTRPKPHYREVDHGFWGGVFLALGSVGPRWPYPRFDPPRYPAYARHHDLGRIARDMYAAMENVSFGVEADS